MQGVNYYGYNEHVRYTIGSMLNLQNIAKPTLNTANIAYNAITSVGKYEASLRVPLTSGYAHRVTTTDVL